MLCKNGRRIFDELEAHCHSCLGYSPVKITTTNGAEAPSVKADLSENQAATAFCLRLRATPPIKTTPASIIV